MRQIFQAHYQRIQRRANVADGKIAAMPTARALLVLQRLVVFDGAEMYQFDQSVFRQQCLYSRCCF
jgi:hypothetical protein